MPYWAYMRPFPGAIPRLLSNLSTGELTLKALNVKRV